MSDQILSVGELLRIAFLNGESICVKAFGKRHGVTRQSVHQAMKQFGGLIACKTLHNQKAVVFECTDLAAMQVFVPKPRRGSGRKVGSKNWQLKATDPIGRLMEVWGISRVDITLPYMRHHMAVADDEPEAA